MTTENPHQCPACGAAMAPMEERPTSPPALKQYMIEYHAPGGVFYEPIAADTPTAVLALAVHGVKTRTFKPEDFEPDENALRVQRIIVTDQDGKQYGSWTDPDAFAQLHADEILDMLEELIGSIDDASEARGQLDKEIGNIEEFSRHASMEISRLRSKGGAQ